MGIPAVLLVRILLGIPMGMTVGILMGIPITQTVSDCRGSNGVGKRALARFLKPGALSANMFTYVFVHKR